MFEYLKITRQGYEYWIKRGCPIHWRINETLLFDIEWLYDRDPSMGYRRIADHLRVEKSLPSGTNWEICDKTILRCMQILGISSKRRTKPKKHTFPEEKRYKIYDNLLKRDFIAEASNQKWSIDISYLLPLKGKAYLVAIKDLFDKSIVAYKISYSMEISFVIDCVKDATKDLSEKVLRNLIIHSDMGVHFTCFKYIDLLEQLGINGSHSRKGNCYDNIPIESFFSMLKQEKLYTTKYENVKNIIDATIEYIEYYNNIRIQRNLDLKTPSEFRRGS